MKRLLCSLAVLAILPCLHAQDGGLSVDADFLTRGEIRSGGLTSGDDDVPDFATFILERSLLGVSYTKQGFSARLTAQHSGTWGSYEGGTFNVYEAWTRLESPKGFFAKVGRQNLSYDDQRIFGADDWAMTARSHDALKIGYEGHGLKVHIIGAYNQNPENISGGTYFTGGIQPYKSMEALWYHYDIPRTKIGASLIFMNIGMQGGTKGEDEKEYQQQLAGAFLSFTPAKWSAEAAYYHQMGKSEDGIPIDAWMASFKASCSPWTKWSFYGGYDFLSGDENFATPAQGMIGMTHHEVIRGFTSINGSHHKFFGAMDFFYVTTYVGGFTPGLQNIYAGGTWKPADKVSFDAAYHYLATATKLQNADKPLGHEVELSASCAISKEASLSLGYTYMRGTETMVVLKKTTDRRQLNWGWIMLSVTPKFLSNPNR